MPDAEWKPRRGQKIERLYAWVATEPDGGEGICSAPMGGMVYPLVGADRARIASLRSYAEAARRLTGYPVKLIMFGSRIVVEELP